MVERTVLTSGVDVCSKLVSYEIRNPRVEQPRELGQPSVQLGELVMRWTPVSDWSS